MSLFKHITEFGETDEGAAEFHKFSKLSIKEQLNVFLGAYGQDADVEFDLCFYIANYFALTLDGRTEMDATPTATDFLSKLGEAYTPTALKGKLKEVDADSNGRMSLIEFLCMNYKKHPGKMLEDHDCDEKVSQELLTAKTDIVDHKAATEKLHTELAAKKEIVENGSAAKKFGAKSRVTEIEGDDGKGGILKERGFELGVLEKKLKKKQTARDDAGSWTQAQLKSKGFEEFNRNYQTELVKKYPNLPRDI